MTSWYWRRVRFRRWLRDHYWFLPSVDGLYMAVAFATILVALAVLLSLLAGEFGYGPLAGWQHGRVGG